MSRDRRRLSGRLGAHPERRVLAPARRAALRGDAPLPSSAGGRATRQAVVLPPVIHLFARPMASSAVVSQATLGTGVEVLRRRAGWSLIATPDRYRGWVRSAALRPDRRDGPVVEVASLFANLYTERDVTSRSPMAVVPMLARLELLGDHGAHVTSGEWTHLRLPDGRTGWAQRADLRPADRRARAARRPGPGRALAGLTSGLTAERTAGSAAARVATALRFLGLPYLWGGTTPFGLDCSGLVQLVHRVHGIVLPRDADLQWGDRRLVPVSRRRVAAGDLVFFGPGRSAITHVGIATGPRAFVNATTHGEPVVRIDRLDDPYWRKLFRGARRIAAG